MLEHLKTVVQPRVYQWELYENGVQYSYQLAGMDIHNVYLAALINVSSRMVSICTQHDLGNLNSIPNFVLFKQKVVTIGYSIWECLKAMFYNTCHKPFSGGNSSWVEVCHVSVEYSDNQLYVLHHNYST